MPHEHIANLIWRKSPNISGEYVRQQIVRETSVAGNGQYSVLAEAVKDGTLSGELVGFEWCIDGQVAFTVGCVRASIIKLDEQSWQPSLLPGADEQIFAPDKKTLFKFRSFTVRLIIPNFLLSEIRGSLQVPFCTSCMDITFGLGRINHIHFLPGTGTSTTRVGATDWACSSEWTYNLGPVPPPDAVKGNFSGWIRSLAKKTKPVPVKTPVPSAAETLLGLLPELSAHQDPALERGHGSIESPFLPLWVERDLFGKSTMTLAIRRAFNCNPNSSLAYLRKGSTVLTQFWNPEKDRRSASEEFPQVPCDWLLSANNSNKASNHLDYFNAIVAESGNLSGNALTARPLISGAGSRSNASLDIKVLVNPAQGRNLTTADLALIPDYPAAAYLDGEIEIRMESMRSRQGYPLAFSAYLNAKRDPAQPIREERARYAFTLGGCKWAGPWKETAAECLVGSLAIKFGGNAIGFGGENSELNYHLRYERDPRHGGGTGIPWGGIIVLRVVGFQIGKNGTTGFLGNDGTFNLPASDARLCSIDDRATDGLVDLVEDTEPPLLIPLDDEKAESFPGGKLVQPVPLRFHVAERRVPDSPARLEMRLRFESAPVKKPSLPKTRLLYLDRCPFSVAVVEFNHLQNFDYQGGTELAYWTTEGVHRGWQLRCTSEEVVIWLPPQGLGEGMEKQENGPKDAGKKEGADPWREDIFEGQCAQVRFSPNAKLVVKTGELSRRYGLSPLFLRILLGGLRDHRLVGLPLASARFEMLYGLTFEIRNAPMLRVAELFSRLGLPPRPVPEHPVGVVFRGEGSREMWQQFRKAWQARLKVLDSRLAVYEVFDDRQEDFSRDGEPQGLELSNTRNRTPVNAWLRTTADIEPSFDKNKADPSDPPRPLPPYFGTGLHGSYAWAFESQALYEALANGADVGTGFIQATDAAITRLYFSALGGWGTQQASFDNGRAVIAVNVEMGRISELRVERIGRIANFWNRAKLVTIFRRTVMGTTQFGKQQDAQLGRPLLRKAEEYVEFLEKHRAFPDKHTVPVDASATGCLTGCSCDDKILVDSRHGRNYPRTGKARGWYLPLKVKEASHVSRGTANVLLHFHSDRRGMHGETTAPLESLEKLYFWTDLNPELTADTDLWPAVPDLDNGNFSPIPRTDHKVYTSWELGAPAVGAGASDFTYPLGPFKQPCNLVAHLHPDQEGTGNAPQIGSLLRTITVARGTIPRLPVDDKTPPLDRIRATWEEKRSEVESFLHVCEEFAAGATLAPAQATALKMELGRQWSKLTDEFQAAGKGLETIKDEIGNASEDLKRALDSTRDGISWQLERGKNDLHETLKISQNQLDTLEEKVRAKFGRKWADLTDIERKNDATLAEFGKIIRDSFASTLGSLRGNIEAWRAGLEALQDGPRLEAIVTKATEELSTAKPEVRRVLADIQEAGAKLDSIAKAAESVLGASQHQAAAVLASLVNNVRIQLDAAAAELARTGAIPKNFKSDIEKKTRAEINVLEGKAKEILTRLVDKRISPSVAWVTDSWSRILADKQVLENSGARDILVETLLPGLNVNIAKEAEDLLAAVKGAELFKGFNPLGKLQDEFGAFSARLTTNLLPDAGEIRKLRDQFAGIQTTVDRAICGVTEVRSHLEGVAGNAMETFRAFGRVPDVPMLAFEGMSLQGKAGLDELKNRFQSVAYGFSPAAQVAAVSDELKRKFSDAYKELGIPESAAAAREKIFSLAKEAREEFGQLVDIQPSVKSLVDRAKNGKGEIIEHGRLKAAAVEAQVNQMKNRLIVDAKKAADSALKDIFPDFGGLKLEKLMGPLGVSPKFCEELRARTITTHGFDIQTMNGFVDSKINQIPLEGEPTLFSFGPVALRLSRPVLSGHLRVNSANGAAISRIEEGSIRANWQMCFGGTPMVTFRDAELRCVNGKTTMDLDPSRMEMSGLLQSLSEMVAASSAASGDDEEEEPFTAGVINELPAGTTAFCRLRMALPDIAAGTFAMTNIRIGAYFEVSIRLPALAKYHNPENPAAGGAGAGGGGGAGGPTAAKRPVTLDELNDNELIDPDLRIDPLDNTVPIVRTPITPPEDGGGLLGGAYFRIAAGLNLSSREAPFNITVFILGGCGWFVMDVEYLVPLSKGTPQMACYLSAGIGVSAGLGINLGFLKGAVLICLALEAECFVKTGQPSQYRLGVVLTIAGCVNILCVCNASLVIVLAVRYETGGQLSGEGYVRLKIKICWCYTLKVNRGFVYKFGKVQKTQSTEEKVGMRGPSDSRPLNGTAQAGQGIFRHMKSQPEPERLPELSAHDIDRISIAARMLG